MQGLQIKIENHQWNNLRHEVLLGKNTICINNQTNDFSQMISNC